MILRKGDVNMGSWDERNSVVRKTARRIKEFEIPEKCREGFDKAIDAGKLYKDKVSDFAKDVAEKADVKGKYNNVKNSVRNGICSVSGRFKCRGQNCPCYKIKEKISGWTHFAIQKVKEKNPVALAICAGAAIFAFFGIFYSVFYTIFSLRKRK